jgi:hypothetical protein
MAAVGRAIPRTLFFQRLRRSELGVNIPCPYMRQSIDCVAFLRLLPQRIAPRCAWADEQISDAGVMDHSL